MALKGGCKKLLLLFFLSKQVRVQSTLEISNGAGMELSMNKLRLVSSRACVLRLNVQGKCFDYVTSH